ncbi:MAG: DUF3604 domain-containing protein [Proteobacteria bacterium]|nr:DUF3604 domain-containing protein [Pseudomonadota bacterium]
MKQPIQWVMRESGYGRSPVVCVDRKGVFWVAWISWISDGECIRASHREPDGEWSEPIACSNIRPQVTGLALTPWEDGVLVAWIDGDNLDSDGLKLKAIYPDGSGGETLLVVPFRRGPAQPCLDAAGSYYTLAWTMRRVGGRQLVAYFGENPYAPEKEIEISQLAGFNLRPTALCATDKTGGAVAIWEATTRDTSKIFARRFGVAGSTFETVEIYSLNGGICALPTASRASDGGIWIAWQSDKDPQTGPGLVRWIEIAHLGIDGTVCHPTASMPEVDRQGKGEDQGFEAPSLAVLGDGRLVVIGRGSQSVYRQDLGTQGWTERLRLDEEGWRCRGRRFSVCSADDGLLVAGRDKNGVTVRWLPVGDEAWGGEPEIVPVDRARTIDSYSPSESGNRHIITGNRILFGDIHQHTIASDGTGTAEEAYHRARYRYGDDIVAVSDHESFLKKRTSPGEWAEACRVADEAYQPGRFVTLHAFEWTGEMFPGPGHKVVYLPPYGGKVLSREDDATKTSRGLSAECSKVGALAIPHHVGWTGANMEDHDPEVQPCWEIVSCHGAYERPDAEPISTRGDDKPGQFIATALDKGLRFGFVGGSDGHGLNWHHGVCRMQDAHRAGLTGVFPREISREGVLEALKRRRCYATSGAKIDLWFEIDDRPMGEELIIGWPVPFRVVVVGTDSIKSIVLVSNSGREIMLNSSGAQADLRGTLPPPPDGGWCYYFIRVVQEDGEVAWSSPIWMDAPDIA